MNDRPWEVGTHEERWDGYFTSADPGVLRNKIGALTAEALRDAEHDLLEARLLELRSQASTVVRSYDLGHMCRLHHHLFQDVYEWAGEVRTVGLTKGSGESFVPPMSLNMPVDHVTTRIRELNLLRHLEPDALAKEVAYLYDYLNYAHPFREGNGRTQREFFEQLLAESGHGARWDSVEMTELHAACDQARNQSNLMPLHRVFERVISQEPSYPPSP